MVYWNAGFEELEHFLLGVFDFPEVVVVLPRSFKKVEKFAEAHGRSIIFADPFEIDLILSPDFSFHYSKFGSGVEAVANKLKQDFTVMLFFGMKKGEPVTLEEKVRNSTAAPIIIYEVFKLLRGI